MKPKVLVILGATSTGKSDLAVQLAQKLNGEVISADSRQVYKGLDLGTGKITKKEMRGVTHYLLDVANPKKKFSVTEYQKHANSAIVNIIKKNKLPIIAGGTGFYIDAVVKNKVFPEVPPNKKLREQLEKKSTENLFKILKKLDKTRAKEISDKNELNNKVRLVRAIEIAKSLGKVPHIKQKTPNFNFIQIGLKLDDESLKEKIRVRLLKRIESGMLKEVENLHKKGLSWKRMNELGLEYRYVSMYLQNKISKKEMIESLVNEINHYAKRQKTWFKREKDIIWFDPKDTNSIEKFVEEKF
jgi:tRNA dimethylallyltransferase